MKIVEFQLPALGVKNMSKKDRYKKGGTGALRGKDASIMGDVK
ncbi:MAG TPA: hypothetical protein PKK61_05110 [Defluviitaleaceae bacterium]|nr:hypothetical protein [Defluviitaleaceae bacterium]